MVPDSAATSVQTSRVTAQMRPERTSTGSRSTTVIPRASTILGEDYAPATHRPEPPIRSCRLVPPADRLVPVRDRPVIVRLSPHRPRQNLTPDGALTAALRRGGRTMAHSI